MGIPTCHFVTDEVTIINPTHPWVNHADGQKTAADDVFDLAELCWTLAEVEKWQATQIANELGWKTDIQVYQHKAIKEKLHWSAWNLARWGLTKNRSIVSQEKNSLVSLELTKVSWSETHFRSFISALPYANGSANRSIMRAQIKAIQELMSSEKIQPTRPWVIPYSVSRTVSE